VFKLVFAVVAVALCIMAASSLGMAGAGSGEPWEGATAMEPFRWLVAEEKLGVELAVSERGSIHLGAGPTVVRLSPSAAAGGLEQRMRALPSSDKVYLVLQGLNTDTPPGVTYNVFLGLRDPAASSDAADPHYVGTLNFFAFGPSHTAMFDITDKIRTLREAGVLGDHPTVTVIPAGTPERGAKPGVDGVLLVAIKPQP
jgi:hypothetical protein